MKKSVKIPLCILAGLLALVLILVAGVFCWSKINYRQYYSNSIRSISIPGLGAGFVPQGFEYEQTEEVFLVSGYMKDSTKSSRIYVVSSKGKKLATTELLDADGQPYTGHCGGIAINGDYIYISSEDELSVFSLTDVLAGGTATQLGGVEIGERVSFCTYHDGYLLAGAFEYEGYYDTPDYHHVTTPAGDENTALIWIYQADENGTFGVDPQPVAALSVREWVQGIAITDEGQLILSTSWGLNSSGLWLYDMDTSRVGEVNGVPLYYLDSENLVQTVKAPPMTEEMVYLDGRVYIMTESACTKYLFGNFIDGRTVFAYKF